MRLRHKRCGASSRHRLHNPNTPAAIREVAVTGHLPLQLMTASPELICCPVCGGSQFRSLFELRNEPFVACDECRLVLINPRPRFEAVTATYDARYSRGYIDKAPKKIARCRRWVNRIVRRHGPGGRWLDVGCSAGFVVSAAEEAGFDAFGVELEPAAVAYGRETLGLTHLAIGTLEAQAYPAHYFDVISMYDVIEHVPDLNGTVAELARILRPTGMVEIRTPDVGHWSTPKNLARWKEIKPSEHLYYFSAATLCRLFAQHGFQLENRRLMFKSALDCFFVRHKPG